MSTPQYRWMICFPELRADLPCIRWSGRSGRVGRTRELVVHRRYIIIYDIRGDAIRVIRILHTARQWPWAPNA